MPAPTEPPAAEPADPVLLFDGECGLCQRLVRVLLRLDRPARLRFAPLQGAAAQSLLLARGLPTRDFDSLVFVPSWRHRAGAGLLFRSAGAIAALRSLGGAAAKLAAVLACFPPSWSDAVYRGVARSRHRVFGPWRPAPLARPEWAERFLP